MATVTFKLLRPKDEKKPVSITCTYYISEQLRVCNVSIGEKVPPEKWKNNQVVHMPRGAKINKKINDIRDKLYDLVIDYPDVTEARHKEIATLIIKGKTVPKESTKKKTSLESVYDFIAQREREKTKGSSTKFRALAVHLKNFCGTDTLDFSKMDLDFYERFRNFLWDVPNQLYRGYYLKYEKEEKIYIITKGEKLGEQPIGILDNSVYKYLKSLQQIARWLDKKKYDVCEFVLSKQWKLLQHEQEPIALTNDELLKVESLVLIGKLAIVRDYFVLACRTGLRISDIRKLTKENIHGNKIHVTITKGNRNKTINVKIPLFGYISPSVKILEKHNYALPHVNQKTLNTRIKTLCEMAGITKEMYQDTWQGGKKIRYYAPKSEFISIHNGKKTFVTNLLTVGIPLSIISKITGTRYDTLLDHYKGLIEDHETDEQIKKTDHMLLRQAN